MEIVRIRVGDRILFISDWGIKDDGFVLHKFLFILTIQTRDGIKYATKGDVLEILERDAIRRRGFYPY